MNKNIKRVLSYSMCIAMTMTSVLSVSTGVNANITEQRAVNNLNDLNLKDGKYDIVTQLIHESKDEPSMAAGVLKSSGTLEVKGGKYYLTTNWGALEMAGITAYPKEIEYSSTGGVSSKVETTRVSAGGFTDNIGTAKMEVDPSSVYLTVKFAELNGFEMTPTARIKYDLSSMEIPLDKEEEQVVEEQIVEKQQEQQQKQQKEEEKVETATNNLKLDDGKYNINTKLVHESKDESSMAAGVLKSSGTLEVKNGKYYLTTNWGALTMAGITAYPKEIEYSPTGGVSNVVETTRMSEGGFTDNIGTAKMEVDSSSVYLTIKFTELNGFDMTPTARIKYDLNSIEKQVYKEDEEVEKPEIKEPEIEKPEIEVEIVKSVFKSNVNEISYVKGYSNNEFKPDKDITRAELLSMLKQIVHKENTTEAEFVSKFTDIDHWAKDAIKMFEEMGVISGGGTSKFNPNDSITRAEVATILSKLLNLKTNNSSSQFTDIDSHWAKDNVIALANKKYISGYGDKTFKPNKKITRAEVVSIINRVIQSEQDSDNTTNDSNYKSFFKDVPKTHWAYDAIMKAAK